MYNVSLDSSHLASLSPLGGVLSPVSRENLQDSKGAGGKEEVTTPEAGHDARPTWHWLPWHPTGASEHGAAAHGPCTTSK